MPAHTITPGPPNLSVSKTHALACRSPLHRHNRFRPSLTKDESGFVSKQDVLPPFPGPSNLGAYPAHSIPSSWRGKKRPSIWATGHHVCIAQPVAHSLRRYRVVVHSLCLCRCQSGWAESVPQMPQANLSVLFRRCYTGSSASAQVCGAFGVLEFSPQP